MLWMAQGVAPAVYMGRHAAAPSLESGAVPTRQQGSAPSSSPQMPTRGKRRLALAATAAVAVAAVVVAVLLVGRLTWQGGE